MCLPYYKPSRATPSTEEIESWTEDTDAETFDTDAETLDISDATEDTDADNDVLLESICCNASCKLFAVIFPAGMNGIDPASAIGLIKYPGIYLL